MLDPRAMLSRSLWKDGVSSSRSSHQLDRLLIRDTLKDVSEYFYSRAVARVLWQSLREKTSARRLSLSSSVVWLTWDSFVSIAVNGRHMVCMDLLCSNLGDWGPVRSLVGSLLMHMGGSSCGQLWGWFASILICLSSSTSVVMVEAISRLRGTILSRPIHIFSKIDHVVECWHICSSFDALSFAARCKSSCCFTCICTPWICSCWARLNAFHFLKEALRFAFLFAILFQHCVVALCHQCQRFVNIFTVNGFTLSHAEEGSRACAFTNKGDRVPWYVVAILAWRISRFCAFLSKLSDKLLENTSDWMEPARLMESSLRARNVEDKMCNGWGILLLPWDIFRTFYEKSLNFHLGLMARKSRKLIRRVPADGNTFKVFSSILWHQKITFSGDIPTWGWEFAEKETIFWKFFVKITVCLSALETNLKTFG